MEVVLSTCADGELFTATTIDFMGNQPQIIRHFSKGGRPDIRQDEKTVLEGELNDADANTVMMSPFRGRLVFGPLVVGDKS